MIRYTLRCQHGHEFESWFRSADAFDALRAEGHVSCPHCGSIEVVKALMAPRVQPGRRRAAAASPEPAPEAAPPARPLAPGQGVDRQAAALAALRRRIEEKSEYVGLEFASEARAIHAGDAPERCIHGEAPPEEARALIEEGVPVAPLPFLPGRKVN